MKKHNYKAIFIGINHYADEKKIPPLQYAEKDCRDLAAALTDAQIGLFESDRVRLILGKEAKLGTINRVLRDDVLNCHSTDTVLVFFSGHTLPKEDDFYLLPYNTSVDQLEDDPDAYLSLRTMRDQIFQACPAQHLVVILDTCFSGALLLPTEKRQKSFSLPNASDIVEAVKTQEPDKEELPHSSRWFLVSSSPIETSVEDGEIENGVFTHHLLQGLRGGAVNYETGEVTVGSLFEYIKNHIETQRPGSSMISFENLPLTIPGKRLSDQEPNKSYHYEEIANIATYPQAVAFSNGLDPYQALLESFIALMRERPAQPTEEKALNAIMTLTHADAAFLVSRRPNRWELRHQQAQSSAPLDQIVNSVIPATLATLSTVSEHRLRPGTDNLDRNIYGMNILGFHSEFTAQKSSTAISLNRSDSQDTLILYGDQQELARFQNDDFTILMRAVFNALNELPDFSPDNLEAHILDLLRRSYTFLPRFFYERRYQLFCARLRNMTVRFQPIINIGEQAAYIDGFEALASDPANNRTPHDLLRATELWGSKFQIELDAYFFTKAIQTYKAKLHATPGKRRPEDVLDFSINVYPESLLRTNYYHTVKEVIQESLLPREKLFLEISEKSVIPHIVPGDGIATTATKTFRDILRKYVVDIGVGIAIDDFGVGHSSVARLADWTPSYVKIDREILLLDTACETLSFINGFVSSIIGQKVLRKSKVVVEGFDKEISKRLSLQRIRESGIDHIQGYIIGLPSENLVRLTQEQRDYIASLLE